MSEWRDAKLGDVVEIKYGKDHKNLVAGNIPAYGSGGVMRYVDSALYDDESILIPRKGSLNNIIYESKPFWTVDTMFWSKIDKNLAYPKFLFYQLTEIDYMNLNVGSAVPSLTVPVINSIDITLPPLDEQKSIASVLTSLDDKIDLLHRQNKTLEALAETLFRYWFLAGSGEWEEKPLNEVLAISIGRTPPRQEHQWFSKNSSDFKWISIKDMGNDGAYIFNTSEYLTRAAIDKFNIAVIPKNTVVLSFKMTVGRVAITTEEMLSNEAIAHFVFKETTPFTVEYLYIFLKNYKYEMLGSTSSIVTAINSAMIKDIVIPIPDKHLMDDFDSAVSGYFKKIRFNQVQIANLEKVRNELLPKLMSGEVRVSNA